MLNIFSKISYKFSTNAIFILYSIVGDLLLSQEIFGKFSIILAIEILIFNISDYFNTRYLLGKFSSKPEKYYLKEILSFKIFWGLLSIIVFSSIFLFYQVPWYWIAILIAINYIQILSSTIATYNFANNRNIQILISNIIGMLIATLTIILYYYFYGKVDIFILLISLLSYRAVEIVVLYNSINLIEVNKTYKYTIQDIKEAFSFYIQLVISMASAKLFMLFLPSFISYSKISIIATYEYILAIPLFLISVLTMSTYSQLHHTKLQISFQPKLYKSIIIKYYKKAILVSLFFMVIQLIYIFYIKSNLIQYLPYLLIQDITIVFSAMQGFLLFFWKLDKLYIVITIIMFITKNTVLLYLISIYGIIGYFWIAVILEISILLYIQYSIYQKHRITLKKGSIDE
ncbi:MAG TPA: hypothetical protein EYG73_08635 [Arcobacter sp.]|nr:hypothetical protein [Arcobacter sp.]